MAVKASAQITISYIVDIQATYRYYLLQGSTLAKPSAPTEFPPAKVSMPQFTNLISSATDDNGNIYNGIGYKDGSRWSQSGGTEVALADGRITGWIPYTSDATYRVQNVYAVSGTFSSSYVNGYYMIGALQDGTIECTANYRVTYDSATNIATITPQRDYTKFRLSGYAWSDPPIVTCNEEIVYDTTGSWEDSEPAYVDGSTNSLYFVDCTVFCDGTFSYSPVSLSSSYEAAKAAYNKANAVDKNLAAWCHKNNTTMIDGSKIYAGSIGALQIDVVDLFAQDIVATGTISGATLIGNEISIGEDSAESVIELCGGVGKIWAISDDVYQKELQISSPQLSLYSDASSIYGTSSGFVGTRALAYEDFTQSIVTIDAYCDGTGVVSRAAINITASSDGGGYVGINTMEYTLGLGGDGFSINAPTIFSATVPIRGYDADNGEVYEMLRMGGSAAEPICILGDGLYVNKIGRTNICGGTQVTLLTANTRVSLSTNSQGLHIFYPQTNNSVYLGGASNRWAAVYSANATIQTSDAREKENILPVQSSELFDRLKPVQYNFIEGNGKTCYGLIAQDIVKVFDELGINESELDLVHHDYWTDEETGEEQERYGVAYTNLIALLVYEVQNLKKEVRRLTDETESY